MTGSAHPDVVRVVGHAEVLQVVQDPVTFSSNVSRYLQVPNGFDGEEHAAYRRALDPFFSEARMRDLEPRVRQVATSLVSSLPRNAPVEVVQQLGAPFAVKAMLAWLGWPTELEDELVAWVGDNAAATRSGDIARTSAVAQRFDDIIERVIAPRMRDLSSPASDVTDELLRLRIEGRRFRRPELVSILRNWTGGDLGSLALCVGVVVHLIAQRPEIQADIRERREDPARLDAAIDELLRIDDPFVSNRRISTRDSVVGGCPVHAGAKVTVDWTEANRDHAVFSDPDAYAPEAHASRNLVYGAGPHVCPGRPLATLELRILLEEILDATTQLTPGPEPGERSHRPLGGWASTYVVFDAAE